MANLYRLKRGVGAFPTGTVIGRLATGTTPVTPPGPTNPGPVSPSYAAKVARSIAERIPDGFPRFETVGVPEGTVLTESVGDRVYRTDTVLEDLLIYGSVHALSGATVTLRRCRIVDTGDLKLWTGSSNNGYVIAEDCEIDGASGQGGVSVGFSNLTLRRCWIHHSVDGFRTAGGCLLEDSLISDSVDNEAANHVDCIQTNGGASATTLRHNTLLSFRASGSYGNAAIGIGCENNNLNGYLVENNFLDGGNATIFIKNAARNTDASIKYDMSNLVIRNNVFGTRNRHQNISFREAGLTDAPVSSDGENNFRFYGNSLVETRPDVTGTPNQVFNCLVYGAAGTKDKSYTLADSAIGMGA